MVAKASMKRVSRPLRIGIDGMVTPTLRTGVGRYLENLLFALGELVPDFECTVYLGANQEDLASLTPSRFSLKHSIVSTERSLLNFLRLQFVMPFLVRRDGINVLHLPNEKLLLFKPCPLVLTIHDIADFRLPKRKDLLRRVYRRLTMKLMLSRADRLIAVSHKTARDLVELLKIAPEKISIIGEGVAPVFKRVPIEECKPILKTKWNVFTDFILFVGEVARRKNLLVLLEAFDQLTRTYSQQLQLVIVGKKGNATDQLVEETKRRHLENLVVFTGFVADQELPKLYSAAKALVMPSMYEGFGLPVIEAMACGIPVIASQNGSLPEIVGDAGLIVDCSNPSALCNAIVSILADDSFRERLIQAGTERVRKYSWANTAVSTLRVYNELVYSAYGVSNDFADRRG